MASILIWAGLSSLAFMVFFSLAIMSILQKRSGMAMSAVAALIVALGTGAKAVLLSHADVIRSGPLADPSQGGMTLYRSMLGAPAGSCVTVLHQRERLAPAYEKFECISARSCPDEIRRITSEQRCAWRSCASASAERPPHEEGAIGDFAPATLGDTILFEDGRLPHGNARRWMYCSKDSSALVVVLRYE